MREMGMTSKRRKVTYEMVHKAVETMKKYPMTGDYVFHIPIRVYLYHMICDSWLAGKPVGG